MMINPTFGNEVHRQLRDAPVQTGCLLTLPPGRGLQAASMRGWIVVNDLAWDLRLVKRRQRRAPARWLSGAVSGCARPDL